MSSTSAAKKSGAAFLPRVPMQSVESFAGNAEANMWSEPRKPVQSAEGGGGKLEGETGRRVVGWCCGSV